MSLPPITRSPSGRSSSCPRRPKALAYYDHPFFGSWPAITRNQFGTGTLTYEGTALSDGLQQAVLDVLRESGLTSSDQDLPGEGLRVCGSVPDFKFLLISVESSTRKIT